MEIGPEKTTILKPIFSLKLRDMLSVLKSDIRLLTATVEIIIMFPFSI